MLFSIEKCSTHKYQSERRRYIKFMLYFIVLVSWTNLSVLVFQQSLQLVQMALSYTTGKSVLLLLIVTTSPPLQQLCFHMHGCGCKTSLATITDSIRKCIYGMLGMKLPCEQSPLDILARRRKEIVYFPSKSRRRPSVGARQTSFVPV